jgi:hypothetical protein
VSIVKHHLTQSVFFNLHLRRRAVSSCICDGKLTITWQQTFIAGSNFDPDVLFLPLGKVRFHPVAGRTGPEGE